MSDRARRLVREAWDGKRGGGGGRNYFMSLASTASPRVFTTVPLKVLNYPQCCQRQRLLMAIPTHREKKFQGEALKRKGTISVKVWPWTIPLQLYPVRQTPTLIAYEMSMHPNPFVVGCTGGMTRESSSTLVWSPGASSCSFFRM